MPRWVEWIFLLLAVGAVFLGTAPEPLNRAIGCFLGLLTQPYWFYTSMRLRSLPMLCITILYTGSWGWGMIRALTT